MGFQDGYLWAMLGLAVISFLIMIFASDIIEDIKKEDPYSSAIKKLAAVQVFGFLILLSILLSPFYREHPVGILHPRVFVLARDGKIEERKWGAWEWENYINIPPEVQRSSSITWFNDTTRPYRLVKIKYTIDVEVSDINRYLSVPSRRTVDESWNVDEDITALLKPLCENFNAQTLPELQTFRIPSDPEEQKRFAAFMKDWFDPHLAEHGLSVKKASFTIE